MPTRYLPLAGTNRQEPFGRVAPLLRAALLIGAGGGFLFACILTLAAAFDPRYGVWWEALAQAHGHLQLFGWAGLFVFGVALHFLPRLRGTPLVLPDLVGWVFGLQVASIIVRGICQPSAAASDAGFWRFGLIISGVLECMAVGALLICGVQTVMHGPPLAQRPALVKVMPLVCLAFASVGLAALVNFGNMIALAGSQIGIIADPGDTLNVTLGLMGFLVPIALAMSAQALPMYAGLQSFTRRTIWILAAIYAVGLILYLVGIAGSNTGAEWSYICMGLGWLGLGGALLAYVVAFIRMIRSRGRIPAHMAKLSPTPEQMQHNYRSQIATQRSEFGPFVALIASAYLWASVAALLLLIDGVGLLAGGTVPVDIDAIRHSLTIGFITLLLCGIAPRMITAFSGGHIVSPKLVAATLWVGNCAALLRVGSIVIQPWIGATSALDLTLFGLSGPLGLTVAICLLINMWPALPLTDRSELGATWQPKRTRQPREQSSPGA
jgi:uncharacterized protein involved in response to NO